MIPIDMESMHDPENGSHGDCFRACIASLLHLSIGEVPHFCDETGADGAWWTNLHRWANDRGLFVILYEGSLGLAGSLNRAGYTITSGPSPRGEWSHAVIYLGDELAHDPHPSRDGLAGDPVDHILFAPMDWGATVPSASPGGDGVPPAPSPP